MSYEGYVQAICRNGHAYTYDCREDNTSCAYCAAPVGETHDVDETNGEGERRELIEISPASMYPLRAKLFSLVNSKTPNRAAIIIQEILDNASGRMVEPAKYKFGPIIPFPCKGHSDE